VVCIITTHQKLWEKLAILKNDVRRLARGKKEEKRCVENKLLVSLIISSLLVISPRVYALLPSRGKRQFKSDDVVLEAFGDRESFYGRAPEAQDMVRGIGGEGVFLLSCANLSTTHRRVFELYGDWLYHIHG